MLSGRLQQVIILVSAFAFLAGAQAACKKKSKKKGGSSEQVAEPKKKVVEKQDVYGKEVNEDDYVIFRGTDKVFMLKASPRKPARNQQVAFTSQCGANNEGKVTWNFGTQTAAQSQGTTGPSFQMPYSKAGEYHISGSCVVGNEPPQVGTLTVIVTETMVTPNDPNGNTQNQNCGSCLQ